MARTPKPKTQQAGGVLDDAAPVQTAAVTAGAADGAGAGADATTPAGVDTVPGAGGLMLIVRALQPMRRRAGRVFTPEPVEIDAADLTEAQIAALRSDPMLEVAVPE